MRNLFAIATFLFDSLDELFVVQSSRPVFKAAVRISLTQSPAAIYLCVCMSLCLSVCVCMQLIVAVNAEQVSRLDNLYDRGIKNEVPDLKVVGPDEIREIEPNCVVNMMLFRHRCVAG